MKTKTLLIAAAALAAGVITSQAAVYSQNIVGYVNIVTYSNSFNFIANQLNNGDGSNNVQNVLANSTGSFVSGGTGNSQSPAQTILWLPKVGGGYNNLYYWSSNDLYVLNGNSPYGPDGWYDGNAVYATNLITPAYGFFIQNYSTHAITNTVVGNVIQGSSTNTVITGFNSLSYLQPLGQTPFDSTNVSLPTYGDNASETGWIWIGNGNPGHSWQNVYYWSAAYLFSQDPNYIVDGYTPGWYDGNGNNLSTNPSSSYWPTVGQGFYLQYPGPATNWVSTFNSN